MPRNRLLPVSAIACVFFTSCASLPARERAYDPALCNRGAAYEAGFNDGLDGRAMGSSFLDACREDLRAQGQDGYHVGYESGRQRFDVRMKEVSANHSDNPPLTQPPTPPAGATHTNNGVQINFSGGALGAPSAPNPKAWYCSVQAFTATFEAFGPTQLEAHQRTMQNCVQQYNPMHCQEIKCQANQ
jgi:hypothetical protein